MHPRLHHLLVLLGLAAGVIGATLVETEPHYLGWLFALGCGLAGGAFFAAILSGDALASGPAPRTGRGARGRPAWFDEDGESGAPSAPDGAPRDGRR